MSEPKKIVDPNPVSDKMLARIGGLTRFIVIIPVIGLFAGAVALVITGAIKTVNVILSVVGVVGEVPTMKEELVAFIEIADLFLLAVVLYIIALGLFELFIESDLRLPEWLQFNDLDDLKNRLIGVIVVVLAVSFLGTAIELKDPQDLAWVGIGTASIIASLAFFLKSGHSK
ncbi:MAG: YqhA family protein [Coriobacteriia bacterium]|nr:YqhA family protein [Coriobacteriia bacterium]